jgi:hypothetical protein
VNFLVGWAGEPARKQLIDIGARSEIKRTFARGLMFLAQLARDLVAV